jgi:parallel beta-helix repeat protein
VLICPEESCREVGVPHLYVDQYADYPATPFSIIGLRGHGKTVYLTSLLHELNSLGKRWPDFYSAPLDEESFEDIRRRLAEMRHGRLPEATRMVFPRAEVLRLRRIPRVGGCHLMMFDTSGEAFLSVNGVVNYARFVKNSPAVIWLVSLEDVVSPEELDRVLTVYLQALAELKGDAGKQELIVVLTKGDLVLNSEKVPALPPRARNMLLEHQLDPRGDSWLQLEALSRDLKEWLEAAGYHQYVNRADDSFAAVRYCIVSAQGADAAGGQLAVELMPRAVLAPLFWLWRKVAPPVWVESPGEKGRRLFFSLEDAGDESPAGSTIHLGAATYELRRQLLLRRSVTVRGRGREQTIVRGSAEDYDIAFGGKGAKAEIDGVQFEHAGSRPADVFRAVRGEVVLRRCGFRGGIALGREIVGDGLTLARDVSGLISECDAVGNSGCGISLRDGADVRVEKCRCSGNGSSGIQCLSAEAPIITANTCDENEAHGIRLGGLTFARLEGNTCRANGRAGIACHDSAQPEIRGNQCTQNALGGILIKNDCKPAIESNRCRENAGSGVSFTDAAMGTVFDNECDENAHCGVALGDRARPELSANRCHHNGHHGIGYTGSASGSVVGCRCDENGGCGINVEGDAAPNLDNNDCHGNVSHGVCVASSDAKLRVRGTTGADNGGELVHDMRRKRWFR